MLNRRPSRFITEAQLPNSQGPEAAEPAVIPSSKESHIEISLVDLQLPDGEGRDFVNQYSSNPKLRGLLIVFGKRGNTLFALQRVPDGQDLENTLVTHLCLRIIEALDGVDQGLAVSDTSESALGPGASHGNNRDVLTSREVELLKLFSRGLSYREAANILGLSQHTIGDYVKSTYRKLRVHSRTEAIYEARQAGLILPLD